MAPARTSTAIAAWSLYDWANSAFTTLVVTFVYATYFSQAIASDEITGTTQWSWAIGISGIFIAILSPLLGAAADRREARRRYLMTATGVCILATAALTYIAPGTKHAVLLALTLFVIANVAFEIGMVFYNGFLPRIAPKARIGRVSGYGWALGYLGGLACLLIALLTLVRDDPVFGVSTDLGFNFRATNLLVAGWFLVFSIPMFVFVRENGGPRRSGPSTATPTLRQTILRVRRYKEVVKFLLARLIYNDGLVTIFAFGGIYAAGTFGMDLAEVIKFGIAINIAAGLGAWGFGFVDDRIGAKTTVLITLVGLVAFTLLAVVAPSRTWLWIAAMGIGVFVGPNQSASRSLMARFVPDQHQNEFFGFFAFSGKLTAFMGPFLLGAVTDWSQSQRTGVATVLVFFIAGGLILLTVNEAKGFEAARPARDANPPSAPEQT